MKTRTLMLLLVGTFMAAFINSGLLGAEPDLKSLPFGRGTPGGRGGKIFRVVNLDADGPGSLRAAVEAKIGPRIVVFEVGGVINLDKKHLFITEPFLTIAGQTAPAPGITLIRGSVIIKTHDVRIRHIAIRPGDAGEGKRSGWEADAITTSTHKMKGPVQVGNIEIDHCSGTWATDENMSVSGPQNAKGNKTSHDVVFSNCIIAEGLLNSTHKKGRHSRGSLIMDGCSRIAFIGNLFAHNNERNPFFKGGSNGIVVNNLIVNPGRTCIHMIETGHGKRLGKPRVSIVGNVMIPGRNSRKKLSLIQGSGVVFARDNVVMKREGKKVAVDARGEKPDLWPKDFVALSSDKVYEHVLKNAGARPAERDSVDTRIVRECREGKGRIIDSQNDVGGYPTYRMTRRKLQIPEQDIEGWLRKMALAVENNSGNEDKKRPHQAIENDKQ